MVKANKFQRNIFRKANQNAEYKFIENLPPVTSEPSNKHSEEENDITAEDGMSPHSEVNDP